MAEKTITLSTDHDAALFNFLASFAKKNEAEAKKLEQETRMMEAQEAYYIAQARIAQQELDENSDPELIKLRAQNHKLRARQANRELQRELSTQGRRERSGGGNLKDGTKPVVTPAARPVRPVEKPTGLIHHMAIPVPQKAEEVCSA